MEGQDLCLLLKVKTKISKKAFQSNANPRLANCPGYIANKFEHVCGGGLLSSEVQVEFVWALGPCTVRSKLNKFEHVRGARAGVGAAEGDNVPVWGSPLLRPDRQI